MNKLSLAALTAIASMGSMGGSGFEFAARPAMPFTFWTSPVASVGGVPPPFRNQRQRRKRARVYRSHNRTAQRGRRH